jgi:hypothetical protein
MAPQTPYTADLDGQDPIAAMPTSIERVRALTGGWTPAQFERTYAPGKWSARLILVHLAQTEVGLGGRARMALTIPGYTAQPFDQDKWLPLDAGMSGRAALDAFCALAAMNHAMFAALTPAQRATAFSHPEYGSLTVDWILHQMAGHHIHHIKHFETISRT